MIRREPTRRQQIRKAKAIYLSAYGPKNPRGERFQQWVKISKIEAVTFLTNGNKFVAEGGMPGWEWETYFSGVLYIKWLREEIE